MIRHNFCIYFPNYLYFYQCNALMRIPEYLFPFDTCSSFIFECAKFSRNMRYMKTRDPCSEVARREPKLRLANQTWLVFRVWYQSRIPRLHERECRTGVHFETRLGSRRGVRCRRKRGPSSKYNISARHSAHRNPRSLARLRVLPSSLPRRSEGGQILPRRIIQKLRRGSRTLAVARIASDPGRHPALIRS